MRGGASDPSISRRQALAPQTHGCTPTPRDTPGEVTATPHPQRHSRCKWDPDRPPGGAGQKQTLTLRSPALGSRQERLRRGGRPRRAQCGRERGQESQDNVTE